MAEDNERRLTPGEAVRLIRDAPTDADAERLAIQYSMQTAHTLCESRVARLRCAPGDVVIVEYQRVLESKGADKLREQLMQYLPPGVRVAILDGGLTISCVLAKE